MANILKAEIPLRYCSVAFLVCGESTHDEECVLDTKSNDIAIQGYDIAIQGYDITIHCVIYYYAPLVALIIKEM